ncbi:hypothetical protein V1477_016264, partial [Vespula maculifrons]
IGRSNVKRINFVGIPPWRKQSRDYHDRIAMVAKRMHGPGCTLPFPLLWNRDFTSTANLVTQSRRLIRSKTKWRRSGVYGSNPSVVSSLRVQSRREYEPRRVGEEEETFLGSKTVYLRPRSRPSGIYNVFLFVALSQSFSQFSLINAQRTTRNPIGHQTRSRKSPWLIQKWPTVTKSRR